MNNPNCSGLAILARIEYCKYSIKYLKSSIDSRLDSRYYRVLSVNLHLHGTVLYDHFCSDQDPESHILQRNAETGCGMADVSLEEIVNFFTGLLPSQNRDQRV